jgi:hypothetical protein
VGEQKLLVGQGHVPDSGPKTRPAAAGKQPPTDGWCVTPTPAPVCCSCLLLLSAAPAPPAITAAACCCRHHLMVLRYAAVGCRHEQDGSWTPPPPGWTCGLAYHTESTNSSRGLPGWTPEGAYGPMRQGSHFIPCLFNETTDFREKVDTAPDHPQTVAELWRLLNATLLTTFKARSPAALLGPCNKECATQRWYSAGSTSGVGPICGVPGCTEPAPPSPSPSPSPSPPHPHHPTPRSKHGAFKPIE